MATIKVITKNNPKSIYIKKYHDMNAYNDVISYVLNSKKTDGCNGSWSLDLNYAVQEMSLLTRLYHHDQDDGIKLRHWVVSFTDEDITNLCIQTKLDTPCSLYQIGSDLTKYYWPSYQILFGVHWVNESHPHIHIIMNTTSYVDGKKFHGDKNDYAAYLNHAKAVLGKYNIPVFYTRDQTSNKYY